MLKCFILPFFISILGIILPWFNNSVFRGRNGMAERKSNDKPALFSDRLLYDHDIHKTIYRYLHVFYGEKN